ncbi:MAG: lipopolysaccharide heptosyltransferase II [Candidatus Omnitrophota bacterium]
MKILQLTTHINIGGIGVYVANLAKAMRARNHVIFVASSGGDLEGELSKSGISHFCLDIKTKSELSPKIIKTFFAVKDIVKRENIELIHAHTRVTAVVAALVSRATGVPYITTCHGYFKTRLGRILYGAWGAKVIAISEAVKQHLMDDFKLPEDRVELIYTGIDTEYFRKSIAGADKIKEKEKLGLRAEGPVIGTIGRLSPVKGQEVLLKAASRVSDSVPSLKVLMVGDGPDENRLRKIANTLGIGGNVIFSKSAKDTKKPLSVMDIFILPSVKEGLGLSLLEAMASAKPCIASRVGGIENVIEDKKNGILFNVGDAEDLARKIVDLLNDKKMMSALGEKAREEVLRDFTLDKMADKVENLYKKVINPKPETRKKILIINVNWLGDVIFSTPFIRAVREAYPESYIACVVVPRTKEMLEANSRINELIIFDEDASEKGIAGKVRFIMKLRKEHFDTAFILHRSFTRAFITFLAGIRERIGYDTKGRGAILTAKLKQPDYEVHKVEYFLKLAEAAGADTSKKNYEFFVTDTDRKKAEALLRPLGINTNERFVVLNPGGNWDPKRWPVEHFSLLGDRLTEKYGVKIVISGGRKDEKLAEEISKAMRHKTISLCGRTTIREMAAIFERARLVISGDSGPMHISVSTGASTIAIFGPTDPGITGPYGGDNYAMIQKDIGCSVPCYDMTCRENRCMAAITPDDIMDIIEKKGYLA